MSEKGPQTNENGMAVVIRCVDVRYSSGSAREKLPVGFDLTGAGASLRLNESNQFQQEVIDQIRLLQSAGKDIRRIIITDHFSAAGHHGCAAYGEDDSKIRHEANLYKAAEALKQAFSSLTVELLLHDIDGATVEQLVPQKQAAQA